MSKKREYEKKIILKRANHEWTVKFLEGDEGSDTFISRRDLSLARKLMFSRHRIYQREKLTLARRRKNEGILSIKPDTGV